MLTIARAFAAHLAEVDGALLEAREPRALREGAVGEALAVEPHRRVEIVGCARAEPRAPAGPIRRGDDRPRSAGRPRSRSRRARTRRARGGGGPWRSSRRPRRRRGGRFGSPPARSPPRGAPCRASVHDGSGRRAARRGRRARSPARPRRPRSRRPRRRSRPRRAFPPEGPPSRRARSRAPPRSSRADCPPAPAAVCSACRGELENGSPVLRARSYAGCCPRRTRGALMK